MDIKAFLLELRDLGVTFSVQNGKLRSQSAKGALTPDMQTRIRDNKDAIIAFLSNTFGLETERAPLVRVSRDQPLPLSHAQHRLWFLDQLEPGNPFYNIPNAMRLCGNLDIDALQSALDEIVRRHETLRTHFALVDGQAVQIIGNAFKIALPLVDLTTLSAQQREDEARQLADAEARVPFDLASGPLLRAKLLRVAADEHILLYTLHHIVSDGWSMGVLFRELAALYQAHLLGQASPLPELTIQYADFAQWQREWLTGAVLQQQGNYWQKQLANAPALLALPTDRPRPVVQGYAGATHDFTINAETGTALNTLARDTQSSLFMVLAAAFNVLLQRYSGQHDICLGTPIANRNRDEVEPLIGFFVNSLVLRTDLEGNPSFKALLLQVRQTTLDAYAHQDLPFDQVVELLKPERSTSHAPLFQVMLALQNAPMDALDLPGLTLKPATASTATAKLDLRLAVFEHAGTLMCSVEYKTDLFDSATIERLGRHFTCLLAAIAADPACPINALPLHTPAERAATIAAWDQLQPGFSQISDNNLLLPLAANNVLDLFEQTAQQTPVHPAVEYDGRQLGYRELDQLANRIAASLAAQGCQSGQIVGLLLQDPLAHLIAMLGVLKAGAIFVSLSPSYPLQRLRDMVDVATPQWLISQQAHDELRQQLHADGESPGCLLLDQYGSAIIDDATIPAWSRTPVAADAPCYIYFTSGSTGKPKAVLGQTRSLAHFIQWEIGEFNLNTNSRISQLTIPTFDVYLRDVFAALCAGGTICIPPTDTVLDAAALLGWLEQSRITLMHSVPTLFRTLLDSGRLDADCLPALQHVLLAGEMLLPADANRWIKLFGERAGLVNLYGPTETTLARFFHRLPSTPVDTSYIPVGQPIAGAQAILLDEQQAPCFAGQIGEIHIRTPYRSLGYYGNDDATQAAFIPNPLSPHAGDVLYRTGDLGCITADGQFRVLGRKDFQIKVRGMRIEPGEIETVLASLLEVRSAIVTALEDEHGSKRLVAYVIATIGGLNAQTLSVKLAERLPDYMVPQHIVLLDRLPLTANGKVDRKALPKPDLHNAARTHIAPRTASEAAVAAVWAEVLKLDRVGAEDDFFAAGGHSLLATQVMSKLRAGFNIELPLRALFEAPTVATLAARIDDAVASRRDAALPPLFAQLRHPGQEHAFPLSFSQQRLWFLDQFERSAVYNIPFAIRLHGALNTNALKAALNGVIARHEGLRTTFVSRDEQAVQIIAPQLELDIEQADLKALDEAQRPQESNALLEAHSRINFDLGRGPLLRALLISLGEQEHILAITLHHIVTDGWATGILVSELAALYTAALSGEPAVLAPLSLQYADFAHWQRQAFSSAALEAQLAYWKAQLAGAPAMLTLPTDRQRPVVQTYNGSMAHFTIPAATTAGLLALSQQYRATLFMTLLAAFNLLLARYSGQHDLCVGTPIANRNRTEVEPLIGIFINTLVLRARVDPQAAFTTLLEQVRETTLGAYEHQDTPFEHLVELLRPERQTSYSPLFQVMLVMQNNPRSVLSFSGLTLETVQIERATSKFDLTLNVMEDGEVLQALFEYNTDLFDETTIARMAGHYATLLDGIVATPTARCADLPWLTAVEQQQLLLDWNATAVAHASPPAFHHLFEQQVDAQPAAPALLLGDAVLSYAQLDARANQLAHALRAAGVGPDVCVGVCLSRSFELVIALLAILKAGGAYVPLDPAYPPQRLAHMLADASPRLVLAEQAHADVLRAYAGPVWLLDEAKRQ
ncbi:amino acid adenylation domain-containing protein, partial [Andreprevotia lacus DSM 23236]